MIWQRVVQGRTVLGRRGWTQAERNEAWDLAGRDRRCWICGYQFTLGACQAYRRETVTQPVTLPAFVDAYAPRGRKLQDLRIEIDHVVALAGGGTYEKNNRLACGWCNRHKSSKFSGPWPAMRAS